MLSVHGHKRFGDDATGW